MRKTTLTIAAIIAACFSAFSQSATETRRIKTTAFQIYERYKVEMSGLYSRSSYTEDNFMSLFVNKAVIYNDILPDNNPAQLSPSEYYKKFKASINRIYPAFSDFKMDEPVLKESKWQIQCSFARKTRFRTQKEMKYPEWSFNYIMTIEMDKSYNLNSKVYENAGIISVDVANPLKGFFVIENKENIPLAAKTGEMLTVWDEEYQSRIFPDDKWKIQDIRIINDDHIFEFSKGKFSRNPTDAHFYQPYLQKFKKNIFGIGVNYSPLTLSSIICEKFKDDSIGHKSKALSVSFFYGKQIAHKDKSTVFFNAGLDLNMYSYEYNNAKKTIIKETDSLRDEHDDMYIRNIKINSLNDTVNIMSVSVPLSVQYLYQLSQHAKNPIFLSFELGVFAECSFYSINKYSLNADYSGKYGKEYFNVEMKKYLDYGHFDAIPGNEKLDARFNGGILGGVGLWFALNNSSLLKINASYKHSFRSPLEYEEDFVIAKYNRESKRQPNEKLYQSLLQSTNQGLRNIYLGISWVRTIGEKR